MEEYEDALKLLYRLNYEEPENQQVNRVLAWTHLCCRQLEQADKLYQKLTNVENVYAEDWQNYAYCLWFSGRIDGAIDCFKKYLAAGGDDAVKWFFFDRTLLEKYAVSEPQIMMMESAVKS
jgi:tetratricopeptide (TPR) repeat protein